MSINGRAVRVREFRCFESLSDGEATAVAPHLELMQLAAGQELFHQGDPGDSVYLLLAGQVEIRIAVPGQDDRVLSVLESGAIFGEVSLLLNQPRTATAVAVTDIEVWRVAREFFQTALERHEAWAVKFLLAVSRALAQRLGTADEELVGIITDMHHDRDKPQAAKAHELEQLRNRLFTQWSF